MRALTIAILLLSVTGCKKDNEEPVVIVDPTYEKATLRGTFQRIAATEGPKVPVEFEMMLSGTYNNKGIGYANRYPVIGRGRVETGFDYITFTDSSVYTADFDWTLILQGKYKAFRQGDTVVFQREYGTQQKDIYRLSMVYSN